MNNTLNGHQKETVTCDELALSMKSGVEYTQNEICALMHGRPRTAVRETLQQLVDRGVVWRHAMKPAVKFMILEGSALQEAIDRKTAPMETPAWMHATLVGFDAENARFRDLCMATRK
jgi:hypothetical protein